MDKIIPYAFRLWIVAALIVPVLQWGIGHVLWPAAQGPDFLGSWLRYGVSVLLCLMLTGCSLLLYLLSAALTYSQKVMIVSPKVTMLLLSVASVIINFLLIDLGMHKVSDLQWLLVNLLPVVVVVLISKPLDPAKSRPLAQAGNAA